MNYSHFTCITMVLLCAAILLACPKPEKDLKLDTDGDGWTDAYEEMIGTNPFGEDLDSDGDGVPDAVERRTGTNEHSADSDGDGTPDGKEDPDGDGLPTEFELQTGSNPDSGDTDDDGTPDGFDDQDQDQVPDYLEFSMGTDPFKEDSDGDGISDYDESNDPDLDGSNPDTDGDGVDDGDDPFSTPSGCTDSDTNVQHAYNSCIGGKFHTITVRYYVRRCLEEADVFLHTVIEDITTDQTCSEGPSDPPAYEDL